jgi:hypothetical protein
MLWCIEQNTRAVQQGHALVWDIKDDMIRYGVDAVLVLLEEFAKRHKGTDRLAAAFRKQSSRIIDRMIPSEMSQHLPVSMAVPASQPIVDPNFQGQSIPLPYNSLPMAPMLGMNPMVLMVDNDQLYYSYDWGGEEVASYYAL